MIPKAANLEHMVENQKLFKLSVGDIETIDAITTKEADSKVEPVRFLDPKYYLGFDIFDEVVDEPAL